MLKIRLQRVGRRNNPAFRVVVTESTRGPKSGNNVELLGSYSPHADSATLNDERVKYWIDNGAQVSDTVHNILVNQKVIEGKKKNVLPKKSPIIKEQEQEEAEKAEAEGEAPAAEGADAPADETPAEEEVKEPARDDEAGGEAPAEEKVVEAGEAASEEEKKEEANEEEKKEA